MALANLYNVPSTPAEMATWAFAHAAHHNDVAAAVFRRLHLVIPSYVFDPLNPNDLGTFIYQHQAVHQQLDIVLGISGYNLTELNWRDQGELAGWIFLNADEHYQMATALGVG